MWEAFCSTIIFACGGVPHSRSKNYFAFQRIFKLWSGSHNYQLKNYTPRSQSNGRISSWRKAYYYQYAPNEIYGRNVPLLSRKQLSLVLYSYYLKNFCNLIGWKLQWDFISVGWNFSGSRIISGTNDSTICTYCLTRLQLVVLHNRPFPLVDFVVPKCRSCDNNPESISLKVGHFHAPTQSFEWTWQDSTLLGIATWPVLGNQNRQAKKVYCPKLAACEVMKYHSQYLCRIPSRIIFCPTIKLHWIERVIQRYSRSPFTVSNTTSSPEILLSLNIYR